jgi:tRNA (guanosine-2'-O-)-methyltransferase
MNDSLNNHLEKFITEERKALFHRNIEQRTPYITVVLEDIFQPQNASAVLRTCDCFGIQHVNIIENQHEYTLNPDVVLGSDKWLSINYYNKNSNNTKEALTEIKKQGYRIIATSPHSKRNVNLEDFDLKKGKIALLFGTELHGLSKEAFDLADEYLKIPMYGFTESFNISVSAAIILHHLSHQLRNSDIKWQFSQNEKDEILTMWLKKSIKASEQIVKKYYISLK